MEKTSTGRNTSELEAQRELQDSGIAGAGDFHEIAAGDRGIRIRQVDIVEQVERFEPELELLPLRQAEILVQPEVQVERTRTTVRVASQHTVGSERIHHKCRLIQVLSRNAAMAVVGEIGRNARQIRTLVPLAGP